jgi:hypothetical protein
MLRALIINVILIVWLMCCHESTQADVKCYTQTNKGTINLTPLGKRNYYLAQDKQYFNFYVNICTNALHSCNGANYPAIFFLYSNPTQCISNLGELSQMTIQAQSDPSSGVIVEYKGGKPEGSKERRTRIKINCDMSTKSTPVDQLTMNYVQKTEDSSAVYFEFSLNTAYACPGFGPKIGGSRRIVGVGGAFLIIIPSLLLIYLLIGSLVMKFKFNATGMDILIHRQYIQEIPKLIFEGFLFIGDLVQLVVSKAKGGSTYQEVA